MAERLAQPQTPSEKFFRHFQNELTSIQSSISRLASLGGSERTDATSHILGQISGLSTSVSEASSYLPNYDQRTYGDAIKALSARLQEEREKLKPRSKFAFKSNVSLGGAQKNGSAVSLSDAAELARRQRKAAPGFVGGESAESSGVQTPAEPRTPATEPLDTSLRISGRSNEIIKPSPPSSERIPQSATLSTLHRCVVYLSPDPTSTPLPGLTLKDISSSLIICGAVSGAIHMTRVHDSVIVVSTRQFRMHESRNSDVYLQARGRPIIEDCTGVLFAPLPEAFGPPIGEDMWQEVDDFKWLKAEASPNWSVLELEKRISADVWNKVLDVGDGDGVNGVLREVGVAIGEK